eukprot:TRINITY_DN7286_c0_g2_i1.p1 TRINITY_DN7286_c0_g2~~TRINITY_DN7286_c0_g2_i1.p1  ORF type:complete len:238 (+),score=58.13 TRINITY_DN7286_c0_g2_i1:3-716(+)
MMLFSPQFASFYFAELRKIFEDLRGLSSNEKSQELCVKKVSMLLEASRGKSAIPTMAVRPIFRVEDQEALNSRNIYGGMSEEHVTELKEILENRVPEELETFVSRRISCGVCAIPVPKPGSSSVSRTYFLNNNAVELFGYSPAEYQHLIDVRDAQNLWSFQATGRVCVPSTFLVIDPEDWAECGAAILLSYLNAGSRLFSVRAMNKNGFCTPCYGLARFFLSTDEAMVFGCTYFIPK